MNHFKNILLLLVVTSTLSLGQSFERIQGKKIIFKGGKSFETNIFDLGYIGQLKAKNKDPFLILTGRQCDECDANISIYIASPSDGQLQTEDKQPRYGLPGREYYYETNELISEGRAFWGEVLPNRFGVIWYQKVLDKNKKWKEFVFIAELRNDSIEEQLIKSDLKVTIEQVSKRLAWEIQGRDVTSEP